MSFIVSIGDLHVPKMETVSMYTCETTPVRCFITTVSLPLSCGYFTPLNLKFYPVRVASIQTTKISIFKKIDGATCNFLSKLTSKCKQWSIIPQQFLSPKV